MITRWGGGALALAALCACGAAGERRGRTVLYASGADLESINPLLTRHPLAKQVQRYVLLTTLARYDSTLTPRPYLARAWHWSDGGRTLTLDLRGDVRWHDGRRTTARDVAWTLDAARDPATGYPRLNDLAALTAATAPDDSTVVLRFARPPGALPDVLTDLAILPRHLLDTVPRARLREAQWNRGPVGNGPFRFVSHEQNRGWVFAANPDFPAALGGPPALERFSVVVVDEPTTKLAALVAGELDFAGVNPAHASFVRRDPALTVVDYPLIFPYGLVFNTRRPPFDDLNVRRAATLAIDRQEIVDGYLFGFAAVADGPVPPGLPQYLPVPRIPVAPDSARRLLAGRHPRFELLSVGSGEAALEQMLQARLAAVGFDVSIRLLELSAFNDRVYGPRHDFDAAVTGVTGDPGLGFLQPLGEVTGVPVPSDPAAAQRLFAERVPVAWLYHARGVQGMNRRVLGVRMDMRGELPTVATWRIGP
ncbi:MAG TPA: ABC transporter substrate-binding protein [Gemmatimonadales bacterium]|nr:ABC transporter substrate-binding protein [Gemmatimonadales bacterium]